MYSTATIILNGPLYKLLWVDVARGENPHVDVNLSNTPANTR